MNKRNETIDILRGIGIILVIIGHLHHMIPSNSRINLVIYSFHMPLFLLVSGYLFRNQVKINPKANILSKEYVEKKYKSIVIPYFNFALLSLIYMLPNNQFTAKEMLIGILAGGGGTEADRVGNVALWFLPMFFGATVIFSCLYSIYISKGSGKSWMLVVLTGIASLIGYVIIKCNATYVL